MSLSGERSHLEPGYRLDRYELLCPIAHGGMASVWLARLQGKHGFEKLVAIKTILPQYAMDPRFQQMFLDEARIAAGIEHANVAQILDLGEQHDVLYLVMEWIDGDSLSKLHRAVRKQKQTIPMGVVLRIMADTCAGMHAAHEMRDPASPSGDVLGIVHRDVSPQNILVSVNGAAKLIDFGIAKACARVSGDTSHGLLKGKVQYMSPEQAVGNPIDRRSDVWALGAVTYCLLTGAPPYDGANQLAILHLLTSGAPPAPLPDIYPRALDALLQRVLDHHPEARTATAADLRHEIEALMIETHQHTTSGDVAAYMKRHLGERAALRRRAVENALAAAAERRRIESIPPERHSVTPAETSPPAFLRPVPSPELDPPSQVTSGTLASAVIGFPNSGSSSGLDRALIDRRRQHARTATLGVLGAAVVAGVVALGSFFFRPHAPHAVAAAQTMADFERAPRASGVPEVAALALRGDGESLAPDASSPGAKETDGKDRAPIVQSAPGAPSAIHEASPSSTTSVASTPSATSSARWKPVATGKATKRDYGF
ncbi:MAG TPA: serine/threonine-protein kinase [Polyangiaceae bacterium]|nr:serine/threonine-protein kinase [Polyangiaceae bacterium]